MADGSSYDSELGVNLQNYVEAKLTACCSEDESRGPALDWLREHFVRVVNDSSASLEALHAEATQWLEWARSKKDLKIVTVDVPQGVLPSGMTGRLHDVKVFTRHGPDDALYDNQQDLREKVARGNCFLEVFEPGGRSSTVTCVIHALKKFTGGLGDDDDRVSGSDSIWQRYFTQPLDSAKCIVCTKKQNGEAAHLSAWRIGTEMYICAGSKNVHLVFRNREDLQLYPLHEPRYQFAKEIARCILALLDRVSESARFHLLEFLCVSRTTAVFELLSRDHQHVEDLSELRESKLRFIAWTTCRLQSPCSSSLIQLCGMPPDSGLELARIFQLDTTGYSIISVESLDKHMADIRSRYAEEGEVLFFLNVDRRTIGLLKKKTIWYILVRAIREKVHAACVSYSKNSEDFVCSSHRQKIDRRLKEIQEWLQLSEKATMAWSNLAMKFLAFCVDKLHTKSLKAADFTSHFPVHWKAFLQEMEETDLISYTD